MRARLEASGGQVRYTAYGYHGTEILIDGQYQWQTYSNYTQGYAKKRLENIAQAAWEQGIKATVFNCPKKFVPIHRIFLLVSSYHSSHC